MNRCSLLLFALFALLCAGAPLAAQDDFRASFESDAAGVWLSYPSEPGWHYTVEYSSDLALDSDTGEAVFTHEPDGQGYGTGGALRYFVSPALFTPGTGGPPPVKPLHIYPATIRVCSTPGDTRVQVQGTGSDGSPWSIIAPNALPRKGRAVTISGETATEFWRLQVIVMSLPTAHLTATAGPASLTPAQSPLWDMLAANWNQITGTLNEPHNPPEVEPEPPVPGAGPLRRYYRVIKQATDSNANGIPDWWELQYGYVPFSVTGESGYLGAGSSTDTDGDGLTDYIEGRCGLNPGAADSDGDSIPDLMEDSDSDGAINQSELLNASVLWNPDSDDDGMPDGADWFELVDSEQTQLTRFTEYDIFDPLEALPNATERNTLRGALEGILPTYNSQWLPPPSVPLQDGEMLLAYRSYEITDEDDQWAETVNLKQSRYRLRTGAATPATGSPPPPVYVLRRNVVTSTAFGTVEDFQIVPLDVSGGDIVSEFSPGIFPADFAPYEEDLDLYLTEFGTAGYTAVTTVTELKDWLRVDANMDGQVDAADEKRNQVPGDSRRLAETSRCLILDINNNNTDALVAVSPTQNLSDHVSPDLDGDADAAEIVKTNAASAAGHLCGHAKIVLPKSYVEKALRGGTAAGADKYVWMSLGGDRCVRVHLDGGPATAFGPNKRRVIGGPGDLDANNDPDVRTGEELKPGLWMQPAGQAINKEVPLLIEGISAGTCELTVEIRQYQPATPETPLILGASKVRILVNVDQIPDDSVPTPNAAGIALAGKLPHFAGLDYGDILASQPTASIIALRGRFQAEIPSYQISATRWGPQLTQRHNKLRTGDQFSQFEKRSTASFWFGVRTGEDRALSPLGNGTCWVQAGLLFSQLPNNPAPNTATPGTLGGGGQVEFYLETGRGAPTFHSNVNQRKVGEGGGATISNALKDWETRGILLDFIMFAVPRALAGSPDFWYVACRDARPPLPGQAAAEIYFLLEAGPPAGPLPPGVAGLPGNGDDLAAIDVMHKNARYILPQVKMELTNSAGFLFGTANKPARVENLRYAVTRSATGSVNAGSNAAKDYYLWADGSGPGQAGFIWAAVSPEDENVNQPSLQLTTGKTATGLDVTRSPDHAIRYFWHCRQPGAAANTLEFWDERYWAFPEARR